MKSLHTQIIIFFIFSKSLLAQTSTVPNPDKVKKIALKLRPSIEIPLNPEKYIWKLTHIIDGVETSDKLVPIYTFDDLGWRYTLGKMPAGTEIKLEEVRISSKTLYYSIPYNPSGSSEKFQQYAWVPGYHIEFAGMASAGK